MSKYKKTYFGCEIAAERFYKTDPKGGDGRWIGRATITRGGSVAKKIDADDVDSAFEVGWRWACMNRPIKLRIGGDLVESHLEYSGPDDYGSFATVFTSAKRDEVVEAEAVFRDLLRGQWALELAEHERLSEALPAKLAVLRGDIGRVEGEMDPLKKELRRLREEIETAPAAVFSPAVEDTTVERLAKEVVRRRAADMPSLSELAKEPELSADDGRVVCHVCGRWVKPGKRSGTLPAHKAGDKPLLAADSQGKCAGGGWTLKQLATRLDGEVHDPEPKAEPKKRKRKPPRGSAS